MAGTPAVKKEGGLLDPDFIARLERLEIVSKKIFQGKMRGERRSKRRGESVEFADYRNYVVGDDLRFLDWNVYARLDRLFLKLFLEEEDLHVNVLFDTSASMNWGKKSKSRYARQIAASLAYIGLSNNDRVSLYAYADGLSYELAGLRGKRMIGKVLDFLTNVECGGASDLTRACKQFATRHPQPGILLVLSDFLDKGGYEQGLRMVLGRKFDMYCIQILAQEEIEPPLTGELRLTDVEDNDVAEVSISRALINRYKHNLKAYCESLREYCTRRGITYAFTSTEVPFDQIVMTYLRQRGLLR
jgi:uncharacterized protein (DUF58 family)